MQEACPIPGEERGHVPIEGPWGPERLGPPPLGVAWLGDRDLGLGSEADWGVGGDQCPRVGEAGESSMGPGWAWARESPVEAWVGLGRGSGDFQARRPNPPPPPPG